jgi:hypothetical protein
MVVSQSRWLSLTRIELVGPLDTPAQLTVRHCCEYSWEHRRERYFTTGESWLDGEPPIDDQLGYRDETDDRPVQSASSTGLANGCSLTALATCNF